MDLTIMSSMFIENKLIVIKIIFDIKTTFEMNEVRLRDNKYRHKSDELEFCRF